MKRCKSAGAGRRATLIVCLNQRENAQRVGDDLGVDREWKTQWCR